MKKILIPNFVVMLSTFFTFAEPGGSYILTGKEKSIEEIVKADMEKYPALYKGESLKFYMAKFKQHNNIGGKKLAPGDKLLFPETKASIEAKNIAQRQRLIGKWRLEHQYGNPDIWFITEYKEDGTFAVECYGRGKHSDRTGAMFSGTWSIKDGYIHAEDKEHSTSMLSSAKKRTRKKKIILLSETELKTQIDGEEIVTETKAE